MTVQVKIYTANELWELSQSALSANGKRLELVEGAIEESPLTGEEHGVIVSELTMLIGIRTQINNLGRVTSAGTGYLLHADSRNGDRYLRRMSGLSPINAPSPSRKSMPMLRPIWPLKWSRLRNLMPKSRARSDYICATGHVWCGLSIPNHKRLPSIRRKTHAHWAWRIRWMAATCCPDSACPCGISSTQCEHSK